MSGLKTADLKEVRVLIPPMSLQKQYLKNSFKIRRSARATDQKDDA